MSAPDTFRYRVTVEYDGTPYVGWQRQRTHMSVQQRIEEAILAFSGEQVGTQAAGRTDSGVHALGQVAHFDLSRQWDPFRIQQALNHHLKPDPISIVACKSVPVTFEARFSASARHYEYLISNRRARPALMANRVWHVPVDLDADAMHEGAQHLLGRHDFTTFRAAECQAESPIRALDAISVTRTKDLVMIRCHARSFLHHQVRSFVGSLKRVGEGKWHPEMIGEILDARDRSRCGSLAPSCGLYLTKVDYELAETASIPDSMD